jgi:hypothetical protein
VIISVLIQSVQDQRNEREMGANVNMCVFYRHTLPPPPAPFRGDSEEVDGEACSALQGSPSAALSTRAASMLRSFPFHSALAAARRFSLASNLACASWSFAWSQGLTPVHFSSQRKHFLENTVPALLEHLSHLRPYSFPAHLGMIGKTGSN